MKIIEFLQHIEAQLVGGKIKALYNGVHHIVAELIDGTPQLTEAGQQLKSDIESTVPIVGTVAKKAVDQTIAANIQNPAVAAVATLAADKLMDAGADASDSLIHPTSDGTDAASAQPINVDAEGKDLTKAPARKRAPKAE